MDRILDNIIKKRPEDLSSDNLLQVVFNSFYSHNYSLAWGLNKEDIRQLEDRLLNLVALESAATWPGKEKEK